MRKIYLSAGHTNVSGKDRGASGNGYIEGELTVEFRDLIAKHLENYGNTPIVDSNKNGLKKTLTFFKTLTNKDSIVVDIHWNAFSNPQANGTEVLIPSTPTNFEVKLASKLAQGISSITGTKLRGKYNGNPGVKTEASSHHGRLGWMKLKGQNVLLEVCFITNKRDIQTYQAEKDILAKKMAEILFKASKATITSAAKAKEGESVHYKVRRGDSLWKISKANNVSISQIKKLNDLDSDMIRTGQLLRLK